MMQYIVKKQNKKLELHHEPCCVFEKVPSEPLSRHHANFPHVYHRC